MYTWSVLGLYVIYFLLYDDYRQFMPVGPIVLGIVLLCLISLQVVGQIRWPYPGKGNNDKYT